MPRRERADWCSSALEAVGLADAPTAYPWQLSGGMQQRVAIARAVAYQPEVLLMDEPFAAVDAQTRADLEDLIRSVWQQLGVTLLFVTHDIDEAVYLGQRVIVLSASPTVVLEDSTIDLPAERDQLTTRADPRFAELRGHVYSRIQQAKRAPRPTRSVKEDADDTIRCWTRGLAGPDLQWRMDRRRTAATWPSWSRPPAPSSAGPAGRRRGRRPGRRDRRRRPEGLGRDQLRGAGGRAAPRRRPDRASTRPRSSAG